MLGRRHLRIKLLQSLYAFYVSGNDRVDLAEKELIGSLDKLYELLIYQLSFLIQLIVFAHRKAEDAKHKFYPSEQELHPNPKFTDNRIIKQLAGNRHLLREISNNKINWVEEDEILRQSFKILSESSFYQKYMSDETNSYENDKEFLIKLIKRKFSKLEILHHYLEEKNIFWADDYFVVNHLVIKTINTFSEGDDEFKPLPDLINYKSDQFVDSDLDFIKLVFRKTILRNDELDEMIKEKLKNWELERLAIIDILILKMALVELTECKSIPIKVSLNEYIELAKLFSTPKSSIFINGILDKLISDMKSKDLIKKVGLGLIDD
ncbi:MAG: transcription antitermination factor NusB [Bacteroidales bacterium]|nr:transcription antitermination factor NusB [Bacteroidales bacterium]